MNRKEAFIKHYNENLFRGEMSKSGPGSDPQNTKTLKEELIKLIKDLKINSVLDAPCGDFYWMRDVIHSLPTIEYCGLDIVPDLIKSNNNSYQAKNIIFKTHDLVDNSFNNYHYNLFFCRYCLVHLSFDSIRRVLSNFVQSDIPYLLTTTFTRDSRNNMDWEDGTNWFPLNLMKAPFNLPLPKILINENCVERDKDGDYADKCLGLWTREELQRVGIN